MIVFLEMNGIRFTSSPEEATELTLRVATGGLDKAGIVDFLIEHTALD